jgi:hypothetical protein
MLESIANVASAEPFVGPDQPALVQMREQMAAGAAA